jgi:hypothetical protein
MTENGGQTSHTSLVANDPEPSERRGGRSLTTLIRERITTHPAEPAESLSKWLAERSFNLKPTVLGAILAAVKKG